MLSEEELVPQVGAVAAVLAYLELRVTRAIRREAYLLEQRHRDRRRRPPGADAPRRRREDPPLPERASWG
jgi:hypothetical protein